MGFRYQDLKNRGDSIELERKESFTTERSQNGYIKRRKTILRERFPHPNAKEVRKQHKQQPQRSAAPTIQRPATESGRTTTESFGKSPDSATLVSTCRDKSHLERAVNRTSVQLKRLAHEIDNEISKLKRERDKLMFRPRPHPLMRNAAIQNTLNVNEVPTKRNLNQFNSIANNIEFTIEKFSSQHKFVCTSPRYARDEQTSCRPRMRTIGLQKDTQRSSADCDNFKNIKAKLDTAINYSATNLANLKAKGLLDPAPPNCYAFDYGGTGDGQNALKIYHCQNGHGRCSGGCNQNECNCQKVCEHYNSVGNYNGTLCNKNTYVEKGLTPCTEYKYCRDEYRYDYPKQNNCVVPAANAAFTPCPPCVPCQPCTPCQPCIPYSPPCPTYNESQPAKLRTQVIYGRRLSDLNTDEFYHPTGSSPTKPSPTKHGSTRHSSNKERLTVDVPKDGRTLVDIERHDRARSKSRGKREANVKTKQRSSYQGTSPDKANRQTHDRKSQRINESSGSADSSERERLANSKEKLLEITFTKERRRKNSSESGDEHIQYANREYSRETKRSMKQMTITAYKPCKPGESEGNSDVDRKKKKKRKSKDRDGDDKSGDDKTWDERLRQVEQRPHQEEHWNVGVPTITEVYDNYFVGDAWVDEDDNVAKQPTQHVGRYRELYHVPPNRSYDIMPAAKNTVRDIPPSKSPGRGKRANRESSTAQNRDGGVRSPRETDSRDRSNSGLGPDGQPRAGSDYTYGMKSDSFKGYGMIEQPLDGSYSPVAKSATRRGHETGSRGRHISAREYVADKSYDNGSPSRRAHELSDMLPPSPTYTPVGKPRTSRDYDREDSTKFDRRYGPDIPTRTDQEPHDMRSSNITYTPDGKLRTPNDEERHSRDSPSRRDYEPRHRRVPGNTYTPDEMSRTARDYDPDIPARPDISYQPDKNGRKQHEPRGIHPSGPTNTRDGKPIGSHYDERHGQKSSSRRDSGPHDKRSSGTTHSTDGKPRSARDFTPDVQYRSDKRYESYSPPRTDHEASVQPTPGTTHNPSGKSLSPHTYAQDVQPKSGTKYYPDTTSSKVQEPSLKHKPDTVYSPDDVTRSAHDYVHEVQSKSDKKLVPDSPSHGVQDPTARTTPDTVYTPDGKLRSARGHGSDDQLNSVRDPDRITPSAPPYREKQHTDDYHGSDGKLSEEETYRIKTKPTTDHSPKSEGTGAGIASENKVDKERSEQKHDDLGDETKVKTGDQSRDKEYRYGNAAPASKTAPGSVGSPRSSFLKSDKPDTGRLGSPSTGTNRTADGPVSSARAGKESKSPGDSEYKFLTAADVPDIKIEDLDDSGRSARSGRVESPRVGLPERAKFAIKGEMVLEPQQSGSGQYKISSDSDTKYRDDDRARQREGHAQRSAKVSEATEKTKNPETYATTDQSGGGGGGVSMGPSVTTERAERFGETNTFDEQNGESGRVRRDTGSDRFQVLSPFPSLESPTIYMRPRVTCTDYEPACLPPTKDCTKKASPRVRGVENAGDVYICRPRTCTTQTASPPSSPCRCVSPQRSGSEVPYEKLGDQYTHSPVRQLAANLHLAVALQPDAATGNYIPLPQPQASKSCIYLRSTGTQYSATIIERQEDRCAPQYVPLPKHCTQISGEDAKNLPAPCCPSECGPTRQDFQTACGSDNSNNTYQWLCDEASEENEGKINFNNDQWCERVEITNSEKTQFIIAQRQRQQQRKQQLNSTDCNTFFLPWQQDQPTSDCNVSPCRAGSQLALKSTQQQLRYQNFAERRTPRFNATMPPHQELPEEEARCAEEMMQYKPQSRVKFMERNSRQYENCDPSCYAREEDTNFQNEAGGSAHECTPRGRSEFNNCQEYQQIPEFTGCPCMFKTYLNMVTLYYPEYRNQMSDGDSAIEDAEFIDC